VPLRPSYLVAIASFGPITPRFPTLLTVRARTSVCDGKAWTVSCHGCHYRDGLYGASHVCSKKITSRRIGDAGRQGREWRPRCRSAGRRTVNGASSRRATVWTHLIAIGSVCRRIRRRCASPQTMTPTEDNLGSQRAANAPHLPWSPPAVPCRKPNVQLPKSREGFPHEPKGSGRNRDP
jgi:hypothetical protein